VTFCLLLPLLCAAPVLVPREYLFMWLAPRGRRPFLVPPALSLWAELHFSLVDEVQPLGPGFPNLPGEPRARGRVLAQAGLSTSQLSSS
jgi:hypothetical protein